MTTYRLGAATIHHGDGQTVTVLSDSRETGSTVLLDLRAIAQHVMGTLGNTFS